MSVKSSPGHKSVSAKLGWVVIDVRGITVQLIFASAIQLASPAVPSSTLNTQVASAVTAEIVSLGTVTVPVPEIAV